MNRAVLEHETLGYGAAPVLNDVSFAFAPGERIAILGSSGAGKSTLLTAIDQKLVASGERVGLLPQDLALVPQLSVVKNVLMGRLDDHGTLYNLTNLLRTRQADRARIMDILGDVGLTSHADCAVETLSGGQKQRTALARALLRGGDIFVGDEPFSAIDETQAAMLLKLVGTRFPTVVLVLHDVALSLSFATRILGLRHGRIEINAAPDAVTPEQINALYHT